MFKAAGLNRTSSKRSWFEAGKASGVSGGRKVSVTAMTGDGKESEYTIEARQGQRLPHP